MATSRPIRQGDRLTRLNNEGLGGYGAHRKADGSESTREFVLQEDFGLTNFFGDEYRRAVCDRVFAVLDRAHFRDPRLAAAITNGTAPGLYVREGDDTSNWEVYREVLARRVEEAMAVRRGLPIDGVVSLSDVRKVTLSPSPTITVAANVSPPQPSSPSRFSLLEVDADTKPLAPQAPQASTGLAALQQELRAEREAKRALAAAQTPQGRFDLLECDLPAMPAVAVKPIKTPKRPSVGQV